jgi:hypothetical protein
VRCCGDRGTVGALGIARRCSSSAVSRGQLPPHQSPSGNYSTCQALSSLRVFWFKSKF